MRCLGCASVQEIIIALYIAVDYVVHRDYCITLAIGKNCEVYVPLKLETREILHMLCMRNSFVTHAH